MNESSFLESFPSTVQGGWALLSLGLIPLLGLAQEGGKKKGLGCCSGALLTLVVLVLVAVGGLFAFRGVISERILAAADGELTKAGIYLDYEAGDLNILKGMVLQDLTLYRTAEKSEPLIELTQAAIGYDLFAILSDRSTASANLSADAAELTLYHEGEPYAFEKLTGSLNASASALNINRLNAHFHGLDLELTGDINFPNDEAGSTAPAAE